MWEDVSIQSRQEREGKRERGNGGKERTAYNWGQGSEKSTRLGRVNNRKPMPLLSLKGTRKGKVSRNLVRGLAAGKGHLMGAEAFGGRVQSPGREGAKGLNTPTFLSSFSFVSCRSSHWMTPLNPREQDTKRYSQRRLAFWGPEQGEEGREWIWGTMGNTQPERTLFRLWKGAFLFLVSCVHWGVKWLLPHSLGSTCKPDILKGSPCRSVLFGPHSIFINKPTKQQQEQKYSCIVFGEIHFKNLSFILLLTNGNWQRWTCITVWEQSTKLSRGCLLWIDRNSSLCLSPHHSLLTPHCFCLIPLDIWVCGLNKALQRRKDRWVTLNLEREWVLSWKVYFSTKGIETNLGPGAPVWVSVRLARRKLCRDKWSSVWILRSVSKVYL